MQASPIDKTLLDDALKIVEAAKQRNVVLRLLGALAIILHSNEFSYLHQKLKRLGNEGRAFTDVDLIGHAKQRVKIREVMEDELGYQVDQNVLLFRGKERLLYRHPKGLYNLDIFFDSLRFSHDIHFGSDPEKGRLLLDYPTIPPADLLLEKLQIHSISQKDLKDIMVLLRAHELHTTDEPKKINVKYVGTVLSDDWGFWNDATVNLRDALCYAEKYYSEGTLSQTDFSDISNKVTQILDAIANHAKSLRWRLREKTGEVRQWWNSVEEVSR